MRITRPHRSCAWVLLAVLAAGPGVIRLAAQDAAALAAAIGRLGALEYAPRMSAARTIRRAPAPAATAALIDAVTKSKDEFVRFRAFVLLAGFNDPRIGEVVRSAFGDRNDRLREVAYEWLERHPDPSMTTSLLLALNTEEAEFVRPALIRALAALDADPQVRTTLIREVGRGLDIFRGAVIEALGHRRASYAVDAIAGVAAIDGPLQDDAAIALGRIGGEPVIKILSGIKAKGADARLTIGAALCLARGNCEEYRAQLVRELTNASSSVADAAAEALGVLAERGDKAALGAIVDGGKTAPGAREILALSLASVALKQPAALLSWLAANAASRDATVELLKDGFDMLEEDLAEESFYASIRASYWQASETSDLRTVAATLIDKLAF